MKALFVVITVALTGLLASCSKDYECVCYEGGQEKYRYSITDQHDKGATEQCQAKQTTLGGSFKCAIE